MDNSNKLKACTIDRARREPGSLVASIIFAAMFLAILPINTAVAGIFETDAEQSLAFVFAGIGLAFAGTLFGLRKFRGNS